MGPCPNCGNVGKSVRVGLVKPHIPVSDSVNWLKRRSEIIQEHPKLKRIIDGLTLFIPFTGLILPSLPAFAIAFGAAVFTYLLGPHIGKRIIERTEHS